MSDVTPRFKVKRVRSPKHLDRIRSHRCSVTGCRENPVDAHHLKCGPEGGGSVVASDIWAVPLCHWKHHIADSMDGVHATGDEAAWWAKHGLDPIAIAKGHAAVSRALGLLPKESDRCR